MWPAEYGREWPGPAAWRDENFEKSLRKTGIKTVDVVALWVVYSEELRRL